MASINSVVLIGRLTRDVELRITPSGVSVAKITLAVDRVPGRDGSKETDFIDCVLFGKTAEVTSDYCGKGKLVGVQGRIQVRNWEANDGSKHKSVEVICDNIQFLSPREG